MSATDHPLGSAVLDSVDSFNSGGLGPVELFAPDVVFTAPGRSAVAGSYHGRPGVTEFFGKLHAVSQGTLRIEADEVLANDERLILFLRFVARRGTDHLDVMVAGFHTDHGPDGWRKATFLPDDLAAFDRFFAPEAHT